MKQPPTQALTGPSAASQDPPRAQVTTSGRQMKRTGEDVAKKRDDLPGVVMMEPPICGEGDCAQCEILGQAPLEAHIIEKCSTTAAILAQARVAKFSYHWPQYRQESNLRVRRIRDSTLNPDAAGGLPRGRR